MASDSPEHDDWVVPLAGIKTEKGYGQNESRINYKNKKISFGKFSAGFVSGGVLVPSEFDAAAAVMNDSNVISDICQEDESDMDVNSIVSDEDFIDRIINDDDPNIRQNHGYDAGISMGNYNASVTKTRKAFNTTEKISNKRPKNYFLHGSHVNKNVDIAIQSKTMEKMYGKGLKMLQKMGYKGGGLGRDGSGTVAPIEVKVRTKQQGLQDEGEMVSENMIFFDQLQRTSQPKQRHFYSVTYSDRWRRIPAAENNLKDDKVSDYTQPYVANHASSSPSEIDDLIKYLDRKYIALDGALKRILVEKEAVERSIMEMKQDLSQLECAIDRKNRIDKKSDGVIKRVTDACSLFYDELEVLGDFADSKTIACAIQSALKVFSDEMEHSYDVYETLDFDDVVILLVRYSLDVFYFDWDVKTELDRGSSAIQLFISFFKARGVLTKLASHIRETAVATLKRYLLNIWDILDTEFGLQCFNVWKSTLEPLDTCDLCSELTDVVIFRLLEFVEDASSAHLSHIVIHPWLFIFDDDKMRTLITKFVEMMKSLFSQESLVNIDKYRGILNRWNVLINKTELESLSSNVSVTLACKLREVDVNPRNQDTSVIEYILKWIDVVGVDKMCKAFCCEFFPKWIKLLRTWIASPTADYDEIIIWYTGWKSLFPSEMLKNFSVQEFFKEALKIMDKASARDDTDVPEVSNGFIQKQQSEESALEILETIAEKNGIPMQPRVGRTHNGKQIYAFGSATVILEKDTVLHMKKGTFHPISIDQLIKLASTEDNVTMHKY